MQVAIADDELSIPKSIVTSRVAQTRLLVGLLQGLVLYLLYWSSRNATWPAITPYVFVPLVLVFLFVPVLFISGIGHLETRRIAIWIGAAVAVCIVLGLCDVWRASLFDRGWFDDAANPIKVMPSGWLIMFAAAGFYIAHALVLAGAADNRRIAPYPQYFEAAWKLIIQIKFSMLFVGVLWLILWLGATLFMLVKLNFLRELLSHAWFGIPVTAFAFSTAMHITDVRPGIVRGIRSLLLVLMSWLLPVTVLIVGGFLASLPFVGLEPLWATRHATSVLLGATAVLVLLINATFQGGELGKQVTRLLRVAARLACILLLPMVLIAAYALALRVQQYGWTSDRIIAAASLLIAACYACGYLWAAVERTAWLARVAPTNTATAFVILAILLGLFTPIADPARLSVASQLARLESGKVSAEKFDFQYLRFEGARYGNDALQKFKSTTAGSDAATIRTRAAIALQKKTKWDRSNDTPVADAKARSVNITAWPDKKLLPAEFVQQDWSAVGDDLPECLKLQNHHCNAYMIDMNGDGNAEILLRDDNRYGTITLFALNATNKKWEPAGEIRGALTRCKDVEQAFAAGTSRLVDPVYKDIEIAGNRLRIEPRYNEANKCADKKP